MCANNWITIWRTHQQPLVATARWFARTKHLARRVTESELATSSRLIMLAEEVPEARGRMGSYGLADGTAE
ncbi:hypothetical protein ACLB1N_23345 [Escherichia coli]